MSNSEHRVIELTEEEIKENVARGKRDKEIMDAFIPHDKPPVDELAIFITGPKEVK